MTSLALPTPPVPTPGLIATLNARTWLDHTHDGDVFSALLITFPAPQFDEVDPDAIEQTMLGVAAALGAAPFGKPPPTVGARVITVGGDALVWFAGCPYALKLTHPRWAQAINNLGHVLLAVGLDELSPVASRAEIDEYIERARECGRMHIALADVSSSPRDAQAALAAAGGAR